MDVPEGLNVELAHKLTEKEEEAERRKHRWEEVVEVIEVLVLALAAIATAWSGFQASQWDDRGASYMGRRRRSVSRPVLPPPLAANNWPRTLQCSAAG
jgi:hypothetical protein